MITRLYLDNCFTHQDRTFTFETGLTGVIGPNESGKSLIVEMIRYALFGSKALRGKGEDYKKLHVELDFIVAGEDYSVVRKGAKVTLTGDTLNVAGTKPVDEAIRRVLGYDLNVFDVANACNQGNIEALSEMTPANRKAMVDQTVGLNVLDDLIKHCGSEGNALKREAAALASGLIEPSVPVKPEGYRPSSEIDVQSLRTDLAEFNQLKGFLSHTPREPVAPGDSPSEASSKELKDYRVARDNLIQSVQNLTRKVEGIEPEEWAAADLDGIESQHDAADRWDQKKRLLAQGHICCPECQHEWPVADLGELADVEPAERPDMSRRQVDQHRARLGNADQILDLQERIETMETTLADMPDRSEELSLVLDYEGKLDTYQRQLKAWNEYNTGLEEKKARFAELEGVDQELAALETELQMAQIYERDQKRYERDLEVFNEKTAEVEALEKKSGEFLKAREIIQALKVSVKTHLLPSLNKVASMLLSRMTGGERYEVEVDEDFEILIDQQRINTLSGSGKAVANLAIRIALGQILTNRVFSLFMADEVDAAMDDDRAAYTADALQRLTDQVSQVILVTHKRPETQNTIELKK